ncbi:hypothetical protein [Novosphingobium sp.]|uniref:hypothetical protein n=1 Tax=Novosphingobium sp. TaxID=1874826 RepID=UPI0038B7968A
MSFWTAVVAIVAIIAIANLRRHRLQAGWDRTLPVGGTDNVALEREVIELRRRVEVLERIITDQRGSQKLADEIEALRQN